VPREVNIRHHATSWTKPARRVHPRTPRASGSPGGAMTSIMAPPTTRSVLPRSGPEGRLTGAEGHAPVVAVLALVVKAFPLQNGLSSWGPQGGARIAFLDPWRATAKANGASQATPVVAVLRASPNPSRAGGRGRCPRCGSTHRLCSFRQSSPSLPPKGTDPGACGFSPAKWALVLGTAGRCQDRLLGPLARHR
jgi:hypothetical protein